MINNQILQSSIEEWSAISKAKLGVYDLQGNPLALTGDAIPASTICSFLESEAASQVIGECHLMKVLEDEEPIYVLSALGSGEDDTYTIAKMAASSLRVISKAYKERVDKDNFYQNLILDNMLLVDVYNRARKLRIENVQNRLVFLIETNGGEDNIARDLLKGMYTPQSGDAVTSVDENTIILIKSMREKYTAEDTDAIANTIVSTLNTEAMLRVKVAYGSVVGELKDVSKSFKEAKVALEVGKIFYAHRSVISYATLGIGRLIYQLPQSLCEIFIDETFGGDVPDLDEETLSTLDKFFENNLNVSETARQLFVHRNTLMYRIEKIQKSTGLDLRSFDDALTFKIALMVQSYLEYLESQGGNY